MNSFKVIWHKTKKEMPNKMSVPPGEIHMWHCKTKNNKVNKVEVRGVPLSYEVIFDEFNKDGKVFLGLYAARFSNEEISNFFNCLNIARKEAAMKMSEG